MKVVILHLVTISLFVVGHSVVVNAGTTLEFERQCLDLDASRIESCGPEEEASARWDVQILHNGQRAIHAVLARNDGSDSMLAQLHGVSFSEVTAEAVPDASFTHAFLDVPFFGDAVFLVRTDSGAVYKIGNATEREAEITFEWELLVSARSVQ